MKIESEVAQSCPTLRDPMDCSLPGSSIHGIFEARVLEWGVMAFSEPKITSNQIPADPNVQGESTTSQRTQVLSSQRGAVEGLGTGTGQPAVREGQFYLEAGTDLSNLP